MCILFCYVHQHDEKYDTGYELILLSNRDEDFQRPTIAAHVWSQTNFVLGGRDQLATCEGGTWLAMNTNQGKIGVLTNISSAALGKRNPNALRRGFIVPNYVNSSEMDLDTYMERLQSTKINYIPFSFLGLERNSKLNEWQIQYIDNTPSTPCPTKIETSLFGMSNHQYGEQYEFEKTRHGCQILKTIITDLTDNHTKPITDEKELIRRVFDLLSDNKIFWDDTNMNSAYPQYTSDRRNQNSSIYVREPDAQNPTYGTRTSTVILVRRNQSGLFIEKTLSDPPGNPNEWSEQIFEFQLGNSDQEPILKSSSS